MNDIEVEIVQFWPPIFGEFENFKICVYKRKDNIQFVREGDIVISRQVQNIFNSLGNLEEDILF